ncbi:PH domain-containing protein [Actinokineospora auranticolor]|uniref:PH (Pleckstrin Homology) domain-containing protein n=1 Tax=Actinokineospora auranticolor TaxID=155976 RepID=A0A2S6GX89_9PSEU|nr:PH domain-containing protein [Actinokineospora auranticolor]PPK69780.1 PH (Pleckstrin Homology) domain-containing protein [Actinokineospora auranticolor]
MAYPDDVLSEGEQVVLHKHPHWKMLLLPYVILLVAIGGGITLGVLAQDLSWANIAYIIIGAVALVIVIWGFLAPFVRWRTTHFIVTTDRVMFRMGVVKRTGIDIPLARISSVRFEHGLIDRIVGCGTLIIESSSQEPLEFDDIPNVEKVHTLLYREVNDNPNDDFHRPEPRGGHDRTREFPDQGYQGRR